MRATASASAGMLSSSSALRLQAAAIIMTAARSMIRKMFMNRCLFQS